MNRSAVFFGLGYAAAAIALKLVVLLGGYSLTTFGYLYSNITSVVLVVPFYILAIRQQRKNQGGFISGREAMKAAMVVFAVGAVLVSIYNYIEFDLAGKQMAVEYYHSEQFLRVLKTQKKIEPSSYDRIITEQIAAAENGAFKATTGKLFSFLVVGISAAFITAASMKRSPK